MLEKQEYTIHVLMVYSLYHLFMVILGMLHYFFAKCYPISMKKAVEKSRRDQYLLIISHLNPPMNIHL